MLTLHHLNNSRSQRILWLLEELGLPYEIKRYQRNPITMLAPAELKSVHPLGKSPVLTDDGIVVAESAAIIEYVIEKYAQGRLHPAGSDDRRRYGYFLHYAEGSLMPPLLVALILSKISGPAMPFFLRPFGAAISTGVRKAFLNPQLKTHIDFIEDELRKRPWFAGADFSAADIQMSFPVEAMEGRGFLKDHPKLQDFLKRIRSRPAYQRAIEAGGPFSLDL